MIVPPRDQNGTPDLDSLNTWTIACDNCGTERSFNAVADWCIGLDTSLRVHCPQCTHRIARELITGTVGRGRLVVRLVGWFMSWRGRRADRCRSGDPEA